MSSDESVSSVSAPKPCPRLNKNHGFLRLILHNQLNRSEYDKFAREKAHKIKSAYEIALKESSQTTASSITCSPPKYVIPSKRPKPQNDSSPLEKVPVADPHHNLRQQMRKRIEAEHEKQKSSDFTKETIDLAKCLGSLSLKS